MNVNMDSINEIVSAGDNVTLVAFRSASSADWVYKQMQEALRYGSGTLPGLGRLWIKKADTAILREMTAPLRTMQAFIRNTSVGDEARTRPLLGRDPQGPHFLQHSKTASDGTETVMPVLATKLCSGAFVKVWRRCVGNPAACQKMITDFWEG